MIVAKESSSAPWQQAIVALSQTVIGFLIVLVLYFGRPVLIPVALAVLLTFLLNPVVRRLEQLRLGRVPSVLLAVSLAGIILTVVVVSGSRQISTLISQLPENTAKIVAKVKTLKSLTSGATARRFERMIEEISNELNVKPLSNDVNSQTSDAGNPGGDENGRVLVASEPMTWETLSGPVGSLVEIVATLALSLVLLVFFLMERDGLRDRVVTLAGKSRLTVTSKALEDATNRVSRYIGMLVILNGGFGALLSVGLLILGVPYALLWGCVAALLRFIPYIGPWLGAIFPIAMCLAMSEGWWQPLAVFGYVLALEVASNNVVEPLAFGRTIGVSPTALLISAAFWLFIWGPVGLILSAPFAVSLVVIGKNIPQLGFLNVLLGDQPALSEEVGFYQRLLVGEIHPASVIIANRARDEENDQLFDDLIIPALTYARRDCAAGRLTEEESDAVVHRLREALETAGVSIPIRAIDAPRTDASAATVIPGRLRLLCCAVDSDADWTAAALLDAVVDKKRWTVELGADELLISELVARVTADPPAAICIAALPPGGIAQVRYLCKKLRAAGVTTPVIVGRWGRRRVSQTDRDRLTEAGADVVTTSVLDTQKWLNARHPLLLQSSSEPAGKFIPASRDAVPAVQG